MSRRNDSVLILVGKMKIEKVINNNIISSFNENGQEVVLMGRGLGFQAKAGQPIDTDHISFAISRMKHGTSYHNALIWEIKKFYTTEYQIGMYAVNLIKERLGIELNEDEAGSIALHFVNAEFNTTMNKAVDITKLIQSCLNIVKYHFKIDLDEQDLHVERFVTHLKYFAQRIFTDNMLPDEDDEFNMAIEKRYPEYYRCCELIRDLVKKEYDIEITKEEMMYITVHIGRIMRNLKK